MAKKKPIEPVKHEVVWLPLEKLVPYENNAKTHPKEQIARLKKMMAKGFDQPLVVDENLVILKGHGRRMAALELGLKEVPVVVRADLSEDEKKAHRLGDNQNAVSEIDMELAKIDLGELFQNGFDLEIAGFPDWQPTVSAGEPQCDEDEVPEQAPAVAKRGQVWRLGRHRLMCGDSTSRDDVATLMAGTKSDLVVTDPPYNVNYGGDSPSPAWKPRGILNDNMSADDWRAFCHDIALAIKEFCSGCVYVFGPPVPEGRTLFCALDALLHCSTTIIWNKDRLVLGRGKYHNKYEPCWFGWVENGTNFIDDRTLTNVWDFQRPSSSELHPTMKPVELIEQAIQHASKPGQTVLDLFGGSGTTLIAAEKSGREARLMELDEHYCDVIIARWEKYTGLKAELEGA